MTVGFSFARQTRQCHYSWILICAPNWVVLLQFGSHCLCDCPAALYLTKKAQLGLYRGALTGVFAGELVDARAVGFGLVAVNRDPVGVSP